MHQDQVTPVILTFNEEPNLERCLSALAWARRVVVLDSGSDDGTSLIAGRFPNVAWHQRTFDDHTRQWNHALSLVSTEWALSLDADYVVPPSLPQEFSTLPDDLDAWLAPFRYLIFGRPLRASLYPPRAVLFRTSVCHYIQDGHTQLLKLPAKCGMLRSTLDHDDRKPLSRWLQSQLQYARLEATKLHHSHWSDLRLQDMIRKLVVLAPAVTFFYTLFWKGLVRDGWHGLAYTLQRTTAEMVLSLCLVEKQLFRP